MGKTLVLKVRVREHVGSKDAQRIRCEGRIPVVVYGHREKPLTVAVDAHAFVEGLHHGQRLMDIQIGSKKQKVIVKDLQYDHLGTTPIHLDLMRVHVNEVVTVQVGIELWGTPRGASDGGILEQLLNELEVKCLVAQIPETLHPNVSHLGVGDSILVSDLELPEGVTPAVDGDAKVATVRLLAEEVEAEGEEAKAAQPEVIGRAKKEEDEDAKGGK